MVRGRAALTTPFFRPRFLFSRPPLRSISVPMAIKIVEWLRAIAHPARSPGLKTPHCTRYRSSHDCITYCTIPLVSALLRVLDSLHSKICNIVFRVVRCRSESRSFSLRTPVAVTHVHRVYKETLCTRRIPFPRPRFSLCPIVHKTLHWIMDCSFTLVLFVVRSLSP